MLEEYLRGVEDDLREAAGEMLLQPVSFLKTATNNNGALMMK